MELKLNDNKRDSKSLKTLLIALGVAALLIAGIIGLITLLPTNKDVVEQAIEGSFREGSPEFAQLTRKIIAETNEGQTTESPTAMGTINMYVGGKIRNLTGKTLTGLELTVAVIDMKGKPVKEKTLVVIPTQLDRLNDGQMMFVKINMEGFKPDDDRANIRWKVTAIKAE